LLKDVQLQRFHEENGHLSEFAGFNLPIWYKGIIPESLAVRNAAGIFDVSHMGRAIIRGKDSEKLLDILTTNDVASLAKGGGQYSLMCNSDGGIKDDVLVFHLQENEHLIVYNAANRTKDYDWIVANARGLDANIQDVSDDVAMFAVQGPKAVRILQPLCTGRLDTIPRFGCSWAQIAGTKALVSRTGYTGEDGFELFVWDSTVGAAEKARRVWDRILQMGAPHGLEPCGLGARDLLRLEAGLCLYGTDMDEKTDPYEARLGFVVKLHKDFIGKKKLQEIKEKGNQKIRIGLVTTKRVIPRHGFKIIQATQDVGTVTSGSLSPILNTGIAMGYVVPKSASEGNVVGIEVRSRLENARIVRPPFYDPDQYGYSRKTQAASHDSSDRAR
jgi:aminomethyltransferase